MNKDARLAWLFSSVENSLSDGCTMHPARRSFGGRFLALDAMSNQKRPSFYNPALNGGYMDTGRDRCMTRVLADLRTLANKGWICDMGRGEYRLYTPKEKSSIARYGSGTHPITSAGNHIVRAKLAIEEARSELAMARSQAKRVGASDVQFLAAQSLKRAVTEDIISLSGFTIK